MMAHESKTEVPSIEKQPAAPPASMRAAILGSLAAALLALTLLSWLANEVFEGDTRHFDEAVRGWVHQFASPALTTAMKVISALGSEVLVAVFVVAVAVFLKIKWRRAAIWLMLTMAGGLVLEVALKHGFHRTRPAPFFGVAPHSYSFPSGHSLMSLCIYGVLAGVLSTRVRSGALRVLIWVTAVVLAGAIGLSRIYLGVHYPSDVVAGYLTAAMWVSTLLVADRVRKHRKLKNSDD